MSNKPETIRKAGIVDVRFGKNVTIVEPVNLYGCQIGDDCFIGPFVEIQRNVVIGARTRIQSHSFVCELVTVGEDCFIGHGVMFVNDRFQTGGPIRGQQDQLAPVRLGDKVSIGSNATILPVSICSNVVIGAGAVVTRDIAVSGYYLGSPARMVRPLDEGNRMD
jgi:acetyltransferase-like isoleucine patch superfamily enzyme